jgi:hypothetical protein
MSQRTENDLRFRAMHRAPTEGGNGFNQQQLTTVIKVRS